jgi:hypothetical protein
MTAAAERRNGPAPVPVAARFWDKVRTGTPDECWEWQAARRSSGYGVIGSNRGPTLSAHRVAWELTHGPTPDGLCVLHRCDNRPCVNPGHLFLGTYLDNNRDMAAKGRHGSRTKPESHPRGEGHPLALLTEAAVLEIRSGGQSTATYASRFGVSETCVRDARRGHTWRHLL